MDEEPRDKSEYRSPADKMRDATKTVMASRQGRYFVAQLLREFGYGSDIVPAEPAIMGFNAGKASAANHIFDTVDMYAPNMYPSLIKESKEDYQYERSHTANTSSDDPFK